MAGGADCGSLWREVLIACGVAPLLVVAVPLRADTGSEIRAICAENWPGSGEDQRACRERQHSAARELISRIEAAAEGSREYNAARTCIERAKLKQPARIDWTQALNCFDNRMAAAAEDAPEHAE